MKTKLFFTLGCLLMLMTVKVHSQDHPFDLLRQYSKSKPDTNRVRLLLKLSFYYLPESYFPESGEELTKLDSSLQYAKQARQLSNTLGYKKGKEEADLRIGIIYIHAKNPEIWNFVKQVCDTNRIKLWQQLIFFKMYKDDYLAQDMDTALNYCHQALAACDSIKAPGLKADFYVNMCNIFLHKGDYSHSLFYGLKAEKMLENGSTIAQPEILFEDLGKIYSEQGKLEQSIAYYQKGFQEVDKKNFSAIAEADKYYIKLTRGRFYKALTRDYIKLNRPKEALAFLKKNVKPGIEFKYPSKIDIYQDRQYIAESWGNCYLALGMYGKAEPYFLESLEVAKQSSEFKKQLSGHSNEVLTLIASLALVRLYVQSGQYNKAQPYLSELRKPESRNFEPLLAQQEIALLSSQTDSALGNYLMALQHLQQYQELHDSIYTSAKNKQFEELKMQYETEKKDKDLKLKEQNISLLKKEDLLKTTALQKTTLLRNVSIAGAIILLFLLAAVYYRYRHKQKTNRLLQAQQEKINQANKELQQLNEQQLKLLQEKDWLVKEIHHRVKNNLQMVISLLNAQAEFLKQPSALNAIRESRERMQAIAILHQKLYQLENSTRINIRSYIDELVENIQSSVADSERITFQIDIEDIALDISQSVPLGLILNEAITNSIKYAYRKNEKGSIRISLLPTGMNQLQLKIADHGRGLPAGVDIEHSNTLGLQLIKLFSEQLEGDLYFINEHGLEITLNFKTAEYNKDLVNKITA